MDSRRTHRYSDVHLNTNWTGWTTTLGHLGVHEGQSSHHWGGGGCKVLGEGGQHEQAD